jgi:hypothetical protein
LEENPMIDMAMGQQHLNQGPGPSLVPELAPGRLPESLVEVTE